MPNATLHVPAELAAAFRDAPQEAIRRSMPHDTKLLGVTSHPDGSLSVTVDSVRFKSGEQLTLPPIAKAHAPARQMFGKQLPTPAVRYQ